MTIVKIDSQVINFLNQSFPKFIEGLTSSYNDANQIINSLIKDLNQQLSYAEDDRRNQIFKALHNLEETSKDYKRLFHQLLNRVDTITVNASSMLSMLANDIDLYSSFESHSISAYSNKISLNISRLSQRCISASSEPDYQIGQTPIVDSEKILFTEPYSLEQFENDPIAFWNMKFTVEESKKYTDGKSYWNAVGKQLIQVNNLRFSGKTFKDIWATGLYNNVRRVFFSESVQSFPTVRIKGNQLEFAGTNGRHRILIAQKYRQKIPVRIVR